MNSYDQLLALASALPFADKLRFNADFAAALKKDGKAGAVGKASKKEKSADKPKRTAGVGQLAWFAFSKHCRATMPERFTECKSAPDYATVSGLIKDEDQSAYEAFVAKFKEENASTSASEAESEAEAPAAEAPAPKAAQTGAEKKAAIAALMAAKMAATSAPLPASPKAPKVPKEDKEAAKAAKAAAKEAEKVAKAEAKAAEKAAKPKKTVKKVTASKGGGGGGGGPGPAASAPSQPEEEVMPKITIAGTTYWHDVSTNGLYNVDGEGFGSWVGFFQAGDEAEPIRYTDSPADE